MPSIKRRDFLKGSTGAVGTLAVAHSRGRAAASDKVILGVMGVGGRGRRLLGNLVKRDDVKIKYICDADQRMFGPAAQIVVEAHGYKPALIQDFRKMLDDPEVDAIVNATSDRWHALPTVMACQAGKDSYVEKPLSLSIWDGRQMVEAARKYNRVVQVGTQSRSVPYTDAAREYILSGKLGDVKLAKVFLVQQSGPITVSPVQPVPDALDYELWCGPAPKLPYRPGRWFWRHWDFYTGWITADIIHQVDLLRWIIGKESPDTVVNTGGVYHHNDGREQPDTQFATFEFGQLTLMMEGALWCPYYHRIVHLPPEGEFPDWPFSATRCEIHGTKGIMFFGRHGGGWQVFEGDAQARVSRPVVSHPPGYKISGITDLHFENFIECIRSRRRPTADVEEVHLSMNLCHLANISYRVGNRKLSWDGSKEIFPGDEEANKLLRVAYRKPWLMPEQV